ncbi:AraC family transcriptional regulator [Flavobacterium procerum]|uniref:AraC family transcriptional regulator n=1 Tax=Flavobacterium procerum TaxID=1455569 RepID=A0ABV6BMV3_9FLAO
MNNDFYYQFTLPEKSAADFVENIGMFHNQSDQPKEVVIMPDGRIDLFFMQSESDSFDTILIGLETIPEQRSIPPHTLAFKISFTPLGIEYILKTEIGDLLNSSKRMPDNFWDFKKEDFKDFETFKEKASLKIKELLPIQIDERKRRLFELVYASNGEMTVNELSQKTDWNGRQINRYFNKQFGLSLSSFCKILRFKASLPHIAKGKLFPELNFTDQNHFIKEIKKFSGVVPKELLKNKGDRFILLSVLKEQ